MVLCTGRGEPPHVLSARHCVSSPFALVVLEWSLAVVALTTTTTKYRRLLRVATSMSVYETNHLLEQSPYSNGLLFFPLKSFLRYCAS